MISERGFIGFATFYTKHLSINCQKLKKILDAVEIEKEFVTDALPVRLLNE